MMHANGEEAAVGSSTMGILLIQADANEAASDMLTSMAFHD